MKPRILIHIEHLWAIFILALSVFLFKLDLHSIPMWVLWGSYFLYSLIKRLKGKKATYSAGEKCLYYILLIVGLFGIELFFSYQSKIGQWQTFLSFLIIFLISYVHDIRSERVAGGQFPEQGEKEA